MNPSAPSPFQDVAETDWFFPSVLRLYQAGIVTGYPDGTFRPGEEVSLAEMLKLLVAASGYREPVDTTPWYTAYVARARELGLIEPDASPDFDTPVARAEVARLLVRGLKLPLAQWVAVLFPDVAPADKPWVDTVFDEYLMRGSFDGGRRAFRPGERIIRAEAAAVADRYQEYRQGPAGYRRRRAPSLVPGDRFLQPEMQVMAATGATLWAGGPGKALYRSEDRGETWTLAASFGKSVEAVHVTPRGVLLVSAADAGWEQQTDGELYRSADGGATFQPVLGARSGYFRFWSLASAGDGFVYASEYGYKNLPNNARRIFRSADDGQTWQMINSPPEAPDYHNHKTLVRQNRPATVYQSIGDGANSRIRKSTNRGLTWQTVLPGYNPTCAHEADGHIVWGLDNYPYAGFIRFDPATDSIVGEFRPPEPYHGPAYDMLEANGVLYTGLLSYGFPDHWWDGSLWTSRDEGRTWELWATWPKVAGEGVGFYKFTRAGSDGYVWVTLPVQENERRISYSGTVRFPLL